MIRRDHGFSMIDVLVAIVVLATGLLALAVLQTALTRNSVDTRTRTQIGAYTQGLMDELRVRGYSSIANTTIAASSTACTASPMTALNKMQCDAYNVQKNTGASSLSTAITSTQNYGSGTNSWSSSVPTGLSGSTPQYKDVTVTTTWTDASGASRQMSFNTTVSPTVISTTDNSLTNTSFALSTSSTPVIREANPGNTLGVIPIAISGTSNAAATNPKPVVTNTGTTFSQYTYNRVASTYGGNVISARVDTKVIQCSCKYGGPVSAESNSSAGTILQAPYRPTYWDGTHYTSPKLVDTVTTQSATGIDSAATQDTACDVCCRDRNDSTSDPAGTVKFDSFGDGQHYQYITGSSNPQPEAVSSGTYRQACRLIRVDGLYATATDAHSYFFGLLQTDNCAAQGSSAAPAGCTSTLDASDTVPSSSNESTYADFVKQYLYNNFTTLAAGNQSSIASVTPLSTPAPIYDSAPYYLNLPTNITITLPNTVSRWVYARGIYVDHLESEAVSALSNAISNCGATDVTSVENCAFPVLPFTTINMSELASWSSSDSTVIKVTDTAVIGGDETSPKRGSVTIPSGQTGSTNPTAYAIATSYLTNTSLTGNNTTNQSANSQYDVTNQINDHRQFTISGSSGSGSGSGNSVYFDVSLTGLSWMSSISNSSLDPTVGWAGSAAQLGTASGSDASPNQLGAYLTAVTTGHGSGQTTTYTVQYAGGSATTPEAISYTAPTTTGGPVGADVVVQYFNHFDNAGTETLNCTNSSGSGTTSVTFSNQATQCYNYAVDAAHITINGTTVSGATASLLSGTTDGGMKEAAVVVLPSTPGITSTTNTIAGATAVSIPFTLTSTTIAAGTCSCKNSSCSKTNYLVGTCSN